MISQISLEYGGTHKSSLFSGKGAMRLPFYTYTVSVPEIVNIG